MNTNYNILSSSLEVATIRKCDCKGNRPLQSPLVSESNWYKYCIFLLSILISTGVAAQTIQIGSGSGTELAVPVFSGFEYNYSQVIYTAPELFAAGASATGGQIIKLKFKPTKSVSTASWKNWDVYLGNTTQNSFVGTNSWITLANLTQVFSGDIVDHTIANEYFEITFITPFQWTGGNLVVAVDENSPGKGSNSLRWSSYTLFPTVGSKVLYSQGNIGNIDPASPFLIGNSGINTAPQIQLVFQPTTVPECATTHIPVHGAANVLRDQILSWNSVEASFDVYFGTSVNPPLVGNQTGKNFNPGNLAPNTTYFWKVVPKNGIGDAVGCVARSFTTGSNFSYCTPSSFSNSAYINIFSTSFGSTNIYKYSTYSPGGYGDNYSNFVVTSYPAGMFDFNITVDPGLVGAAIWIDWNSNGVFDQQERVFHTTSLSQGPFIGSILIPVGQATGDYRMRVMINGNDPSPSNSCISANKMEAEDYKITIVPPPACIKPTELVSNEVTTDSATISWSESSSNPVNGYEYYYSLSSEDPTSATIPNGHVGSGITTATIFGLSSGSEYYYWVRSDCGDASKSDWSRSGSFTVLCDVISIFPWNENFESVTRPKLPACWEANNQNGDSDTWTTYQNSFEGIFTNVARLFTQGNNGNNDDYLILPKFLLTGDQSLKFTVYSRVANDLNDYRIVLSTTGKEPSDFTTVLQPLTVAPSTRTEILPIDLSAYTGEVYIAVHVPSGGIDGFSLNVDDFSIYNVISCSGAPTPGNTISSLTGVCQGSSAILSLENEFNGLGTSYEWQSADDMAFTSNVMTLSGNQSILLITPNDEKYYRAVVSCGASSTTSTPVLVSINDWSECYCTSVPTSLDGNGITNIEVGTTNFPIPVVTYSDQRATPIDLVVGELINVQIDFQTGYSYDANIWIDFNDNGNFTDLGELVYSGESAEAFSYLLNASFTLDVGAALGPHRMRIGTADIGQNPPDPCYSGSYGVTVDFIANILPDTIWYIDADGDGYGDANVSVDAIEIPEGYVDNATDCDDSNAFVWQNAMLLVDNDGDGYTVGNAGLVCYGNLIPQGYVLTSLGEDCDDNNAQIFQSSLLFIDADGDGYTVNQSMMVCYGLEIPEGYSVTSLGEDCDDDNSTVNPGATEIVGNGIDENCNGMLDDVLSNIAATTVRADFCGATVGALDNIFPVGIVGATGYKFNIYDVTGATLVASIENPYSRFRFAQFNFDFNTTYQVRIQTKVGTEYSQEGAACAIRIGNVPTTTLIASQCGSTVEPLDNIFPLGITGATGYIFNIYDASGLNLIASIENTTSRFRCNQFTYERGTTYQVKVQVKRGAMVGVEGAGCLITVAIDSIGLKQELIKDKDPLEFKIIAYPNPFDGHFKLLIASDSASKIQVRVYDMIGKLLEYNMINVSDLQEFEVGNGYRAGIYNIVVIQDSNVQTVRVIKR